MRVLTTAVVLALVLGIAQDHGRQALAQSNPTNPIYAGSQDKANRPCDEERYEVKPAMGTEVVRFKVRALIRCAVARWPVPGGLSKAWQVADDESSYWAWAHNGPCLGIYQISAWSDRARTWLRREWFAQHQRRRVFDTYNGAYLARANVLTAIVWAHHLGWGAWSTA